MQQNVTRYSYTYEKDKITVKKQPQLIEVKSTKNVVARSAVNRIVPTTKLTLAAAIGGVCMGTLQVMETAAVLWGEWWD